MLLQYFFQNKICRILILRALDSEKLLSIVPDDRSKQSKDTSGFLPFNASLYSLALAVIVTF